ncbi:autotransporter assembly complex family protein [uncultured Oxalicibacterium sp.]|uniref:autotransporter assembly complex protein TamA n=1 Tax=uncultured Oxalicibacterium sp. TaxID=1168540 RepID=UPI0025E3661B|nr:autotransporter assembly complex family protein [uncultured Oxalicibacterium sp.]
MSARHQFANPLAPTSDIVPNRITLPTLARPAHAAPLFSTRTLLVALFFFTCLLAGQGWAQDKLAPENVTPATTAASSDNADSPATTSEGDRIMPYRVEIEGAGGLTPFLTDNLELSKRRDQSLKEDEVERLIAIAPNQIRSLLATEGYFSAKVTHEVERDGSPWVARFRVELNERTLVTAVDLVITGHITEADPRRVERLRRQWGLKVGGIFQQKAWDDAKSEMLKSLLVRDYPAAAITNSEARIEPLTASATLRIEVDSGPAFTFGEVEITGLQRYESRIVTDLNPIKPGDPYSQEKLNELQARVQDTGYFRSAFATVDIDPAKPNNVPVRLDLNENERKRLSLGIGFSTDSGARLQVKWLNRSFLGRDWRLESNLKVDRDNRLIGSNVYLPPISNGWRPSMGAQYEYTNSAGEINNKIQAGPRLTSPDRNNEQVWALTAYADQQRVGDTYRADRQALLASYTYTRRRVDNMISPTRGYVASIELGAGPSGILNEENIARVVARAAWLSPTWNRRLQAVLRGQVGQVFGAGRDTVPGDLLFRTGGDQTVRGYGYNRLGVSQDGAIVGGVVTAVASAELVYRINPSWGAAVFTDAGNAADSWGQFKFMHGSGVGARWRSPIGPVNLDLAYGHETKEPRLHFSIGYGF